jgi:hypothetical protein
MLFVNTPPFIRIGVGSLNASESDSEHRRGSLVREQLTCWLALVAGAPPPRKVVHGDFHQLLEEGRWEGRGFNVVRKDAWAALDDDGREEGGVI